MRKACRVGLANVGIEYTGHLLLGYKLPSSWLRSNSFKRTMKGCRSLGQMISQANQVWYAQSNPMILIMNGEVNCKLAGKFNRSELLRLSILEQSMNRTIHDYSHISRMMVSGCWALEVVCHGIVAHHRAHTTRQQSTKTRKDLNHGSAQTNKHGMSLHCRKNWTWIHENFRASICRKAANSVDLQASSQLLAPNLICFTATSSSTIQRFLAFPALEFEVIRYQTLWYTVYIVYLYISIFIILHIRVCMALRGWLCVCGIHRRKRQAFRENAEPKGEMQCICCFPTCSPRSSCASPCTPFQ